MRPVPGTASDRSPAEVARWMDAAGFDVTREIDMFDDKFFVVYTKR